MTGYTIGIVHAKKLSRDITFTLFHSPVNIHGQVSFCFLSHSFVIVDEFVPREPYDQKYL